MIIRAVESDDEDSAEERAQVTASSFYHENPLNQNQNQTRRLMQLHWAKWLWIGASMGLVVLLLVDLAALTSVLAALSSDVPSSTSSCATASFALISLIICPVNVLTMVTNAGFLNHLVGLVMAASWLLHREANKTQSKSRKAGQWSWRWIWLIAACVLLFGHVVTCAYVLFALLESHDDLITFWMGAKPRRKTALPP